jgi:putative phosphonate metabolism protein
LTRYALYYAPPAASPLFRFGAGILGTDAETGVDAPFLSGPPFDESDWPDLTAEPRRYGFHATLKAPFALADDAAEADLLLAARSFARARKAFVVPRLTVAALGDFVALVPADPAPALDELAADCVRAIDPLRAPLTDADRARRLSAPLTERQVGYLDRWGYPYVLEEFRFHMTLTGRLPAERRERVRTLLAERYATLPPGLPVDGVCVFRQADRNSRFAILERCPFSA